MEFFVSQIKKEIEAYKGEVICPDTHTGGSGLEPSCVQLQSPRSSPLSSGSLHHLEPAYSVCKELLHCFKYSCVLISNIQ